MSAAQKPRVRLRNEFQVNSGTPDAPTRSKHPAPFSLRLSAEERAFLEERAGDQPLGAYIRECLLGENATKRRKSRKPTVDDKKLALLLAQLGQSRMPSNLNQLAKAANTGTLDVSRDIEQELKDACGAIMAMRDALIIALGLKPESYR